MTDLEAGRGEELDFVLASLDDLDAEMRRFLDGHSREEWFEVYAGDGQALSLLKEAGLILEQEYVGETCRLRLKVTERDLGRLRNLTYLGFAYNKLEGSIPDFEVESITLGHSLASLSLERRCGEPAEPCGMHARPSASSG